MPCADVVDQLDIGLGSSARGIGGCAVQTSPKGCGSAITGVRNLWLEIINAVSCGLDAIETAKFKVILFGVCLHLARGEFCSAKKYAAMCAKMSSLIYRAEQAPSLNIETELLASPGHILRCQYFSGTDYVLWYFGNRGWLAIFQVFLRLSFHLLVFSLQSSVLLITDFIFAISNLLFGPCWSLISAGGKMEKVRLSLVKLI